jgi:hypothetical protein
MIQAPGMRSTRGYVGSRTANTYGLQMSLRLLRLDGTKHRTAIRHPGVSDSVP